MEEVRATIIVISKLGYINLICQLVIEPQFYGAMAFYGGLALVNSDSKQYMVINTKGERSLESTYKHILRLGTLNYVDANKGVLLLKKNNNYKILDITTGEEKKIDYKIRTF